MLSPLALEPCNSQKLCACLEQFRLLNVFVSLMIYKKPRVISIKPRLARLSHQPFFAAQPCYPLAVAFSASEPPSP